ncbi:MAG: CDP-diacylglycerol--glycerol-3-phosphate 3-phosphatidyltransferase [Kiritimatiellae bacterium]|nr:CDP-diacylglycerol--glycerol-3-phosphate 3-phosphatidyltransferase [Kiritimatiellia bacterium]MDW8458660.1 CDP-diacylglycerol--glycerol-3-phosphate 3-phosphatidyltransferase [Verrucomicrobiota bacterium]
MNLPNLLTMSRLALAGVIMALLTIQKPFFFSAALFVFILAGITDFLDGHIARKRRLISSFGRLMDPLTDKVMVCAAFVSFVEIQIPRGSQLAPLVPAWIVVVIISREFLVTGLRLLAASRGNILSAGKWGKHKTVWQIVAIVLLLLGLAIRHDILHGASPQLLANYDFAFFYIARGLSLGVAVITVASGALYFLQHRELISGGRT